MLNESRFVYICAAYVPSANSKYYSDEIFINIEKDITFYSRNGDCIILVGDFNARTSNNPDFIDTSMNDKSFEVIDAPQDVQSVSINTGRNNYDSYSNKHGDRILDICKTCNLRILNGRKSGDTFGKPTFYSHDGSSSCIGYIISGRNKGNITCRTFFLNQVSNFFEVVGATGTPAMTVGHCPNQLGVWGHCKPPSGSRAEPWWGSRG